MDNDKIKQLIKLAHDSITRKKGKEYAPDVHEIQAWIDDYLNNNPDDLDEAKKTDFSKEKSQGLHGWFARRGGGGSSGWVDCNTCRKDPDTGRKKCRPCGRQDGEKRKYPACRPTPASCGTRGKGKKWGKKSHNESEEAIQESIDKIAGVWDTNEKFADGTEFKIRFKVSDIIDLAKDKPVQELNPNEIDYDFSGRQEDSLETKKRVMNADLSYPIIVVKNENNKIFTILDGTHRLEKALDLGLDKIKAKVLDKEDLVQFKTDKLNEKTMKNLIKQKLHEMVEEGHSEFQNYMFFNNLKTIHDAIAELMQMDPHAVDQLLSDGHNWATDHLATSADDIEEVYHFLNATLGEHEPDSYDGHTEAGYEDEYGSVEDGMPMMNEAEYKGRKVQLGKPTRGDVKKYKVFVKNAKGNVVKVNFGDKNMEIKRDNPKRRKSFRARHKCAQAKDRTSPKYWSCRKWSKKPVSKIVGESFGDFENSRIFVKKNEMTQPATKPLVPETKPKTTPNQPVKPSRKNKPFLPEVTPGIKTDPKAINEGKFDFETYHKTLASTLEEIQKNVAMRGYDPIEFDIPEIEHIAYGTTRKMTKQLSMGGVPKKNKYLQVQIYRMDSGTYELNMYVG